MVSFDNEVGVVIRVHAILDTEIIVFIDVSVSLSVQINKISTRTDGEMSLGRANYQCFMLFSLANCSWCPLVNRQSKEETTNTPVVRIREDADQMMGKTRAQ